MKLVLDNNPLFSIMNPKSISAYLFASIKCGFIAPEFIKSELAEHKEECLAKSRLSEHEFEMRQKEVEESIDFFESSKYEDFLDKASDLTSDPDDIDFLALALSAKASIWSNDPHLRQQSSVRVFTTDDLLKLFLRGRL